MSVVEQSVVVATTPEDLFAVVSDLAALAEWVSAVVEIREVSSGEIAVGTTYVEVARFMSKEIETPKEVVAYDPPHSIVVRSTGGPIPQTFTLTVTPTSQGAQLTARLEAEPGSVFGLIPESVLVTAMKVIMAGDLNRLKRRLEK